ncbi:MAG TPA: hypothetical protein VEM58_03335 [Streptosporangiaceae bacterium]|nr:hypothetical protein [Streptosporangiaceae bacterium]
MAANEVVVDERGRTSLARVRSHDYDRYTVEELPDGTLMLTPAVTISALELAALRDETVRAAVAADSADDEANLRPYKKRSGARREAMSPYVARGKSSSGDHGSDLR